ncbi:SPOR domain-containing protein [Paenibacillus rhizoplanae]
MEKRTEKICIRQRSTIRCMKITGNQRRTVMVSPALRGNSSGGSFHTRRPSYWWKFALSIAGALGTGILLGYAALSFITGGTGETGKAPGNAAVKTGITQGQNAANSGTAADITGVPAEQTGEAVSAQIPVQVAPQSYYLLQYGVFSTPAGAEQARQELLTAGLAAGLDPADGNRVYAGLSPDREQAKLLSNGLKGQGIELYVREVSLPAVNQVRYTGTGGGGGQLFHNQQPAVKRAEQLVCFPACRGAAGTAEEQ